MARKMKDSGVRWIGQTPEEWEITQLKRYTTTNNGREIQVEVDKTSQNAFPVYGSGGIFKYTTDYLYSGTAVMFGRKRNVKLDSRYIEALLRTTTGIEEMHRFSYGVADFRLRLYWPEFKNICVCIPSYEEQREIADYIDEKSQEIDRLIDSKNQLLIELEAYKKTVIYEYVTGKKEVPVCQ